MSTVGIIAEYNPFHNGHLYHLLKSKQITNSDSVIVVMSGSFTQSGNISIYDKFTRAKIAINNGADLVIELPTIYANSSANYFAFGAIRLLDELKVVDSICFGSECNNIKELNEIITILEKCNDDIQKNIHINIKSGMSFAASRDMAIKKYLNSSQISVLRLPNNILGIEYLKNLNDLNSKIKPYSITRNIANFNDTNIKGNTNFASATSIRNSIYNNNISLLKEYVPIDTYTKITNTRPTSNEDIFSIIKYKIITERIEDISNIFEVTEGLENRILKEINTSQTYDEFTKNIKSKRYQLSKIKRMLVNILLNITKDDFKFAYNNKVSYAHILACSNNGKKILSDISRNSNIDIITSINEKTLNKISYDTKKYLNYDIKATNIHSILNNENINKDYTNKL